MPAKSICGSECSTTCSCTVCPFSSERKQPEQIGGIDILPLDQTIDRLAHYYGMSPRALIAELVQRQTYAVVSQLSYDELRNFSYKKDARGQEEESC